MTARTVAAGAGLVIDGRRVPLRVELLGRALSVTGAGLAPVLHPLARLHRVTIGGEATLDAAALLALARSACPVGFVDGEGRLAGVLVPLAARRTSLSQALDRLAARPDWALRLDDWRRARISRLARPCVADAAAAARQGWTAAEALVVMAAEVTRGGRARIAAEARSHALLLAEVALGEAGVPSRWRGASGDPARNLAPLFGQIALWHLVYLLRRPYLRRAFAAAWAVDARAEDTKGGARGAGRATHAALAVVERFIRPKLAGESRMFHAWLLDLAAGAGEGGREGLEWVG